MRKHRPSECRCALLGPIFFHPLTAAPAVQRYLVAPAEAIFPLPIKNQSSTIVNRQFLPQLGRKRISTKMEVAVDDVLFLTTKGTEITKFSDIFIFVSFVLSVVDSIVFEPQMAQVSQNVNLMK